MFSIGICLSFFEDFRISTLCEPIRRSCYVLDQQCQKRCGCSSSRIVDALRKCVLNSWARTCRRFLSATQSKVHMTDDPVPVSEQKAVGRRFLFTKIKIKIVVIL
ncbi:unnamed protein product, partial [Nesidiocoris tenuis]